MQPGVVTSQTMGGKLLQFSQPLYATDNTSSKKCSSANESFTLRYLWWSNYKPSQY